MSIRLPWAGVLQTPKRSVCRDIRLQAGWALPLKISEEHLQAGAFDINALPAALPEDIAIQFWHGTGGVAGTDAVSLPPDAHARFLNSNHARAGRLP